MPEAGDTTGPLSPGAPRAADAARYDAFLAYSRADRATADAIVRALKSRDKTLWIDVEDIVGGANWRERVKLGIEACKALVFLMSPDSLRSDECREELEQAQQLNKLIIPVCGREVDLAEVPAALADREWIFVRAGEPFEAAMNRLDDALETDVVWRDRHTRLAGRAREWIVGERDQSLLLRGTDLKAAERWLTEQADHRQRATAEQAEYIVRSRRAATARQRTLTGAVAAALLISIALGLYAVIQRQTAVRQKLGAVSRSLATQSTARVDDDVDQAALLSLEAYRLQPTFEARNTVLTVIPRVERARPALVGHRAPVSGISFGRGGRLLATASSAGRSLRMWALPSAEPVGRPATLDVGSYIALSPDGRTLAHGYQVNTMELWDVAGRRKLTPPRRAGSRESAAIIFGGIAFSPDGRIVAASHETGLRMWDIARRRPRGDETSGHTSFVYALAFSPDGKRLASGSADRTARLWSVATGRAIGRPLRAHTGHVWSAAFSRDGALLATGSEDTTIRIWDRRRGGALRSTLRGHRDLVRGLAFSSDGATLASVADDATVRLWDVRTRRSVSFPIERDNTSTAFADVEFSSDGRTLAVAHDRRVRLWNVARGGALGYRIARDEFGAGLAALSPDGSSVTVAGLDVGRIWDRRRNVVRDLDGLRESSSSALAFAPDGKTMAAGGQDGVLLWDVRTGRRLPGVLADADGNDRADSISTLAFSPDATKVVTGGYDGVQAWDAGTWAPIGRALKGHPYDIHEVAFAPDSNTVASVGEDDRLRLWDIAGQRAIGRPLAGHTGEVEDVAFSPDGRMLATAGSDGTLRLWDVARHRALGQPLTGHEGRVTEVAFSPDGATIATGGEDATVRLWDRAERRALGPPLTAHTGLIAGLTFSRDGSELISVDNDATAHVWHSIRWSRSYRALRARVCAAVGRDLSRAEWRELVPDVEYHGTCSAT